MEEVRIYAMKPDIRSSLGLDSTKPDLFLLKHAELH